MTKPIVGGKKMMDGLREWRLRLKNENDSSESNDYWNEEEYEDETVYKAIRAAIKERGRLRRLFKILKAILIDVDKKYGTPGSLPASVSILLNNIRDLDLGGEEGK